MTRREQHEKWLIRCLTVLAMVCLIPGIVLKAAAETVPVHCAFCGIREEREARRYEKYDSTYHRVYVTECQNCHKDGNITHLQVHSGGTQGPTCTEGKICKNAARNTTSPVTHGASGSLTATARTPADARTPTATQKKRTYPAAATAARPASGRERAPLAEGVTTAVTTWCSTQQKLPPVRKRAGAPTTPAPAATTPPMRSSPR